MLGLHDTYLQCGPTVWQELPGATAAPAMTVNNKPIFTVLWYFRNFGAVDCAAGVWEESRTRAVKRTKAAGSPSKCVRTGTGVESAICEIHGPSQT